MSFRKYNFYQNEKLRTTLFSKGGSIEGDVIINGDMNFKGGINGNFNFDGILDMSENKIFNVSDIIYSDDPHYIVFNNNASPKSYIWYDYDSGVNEFDWLRFGTGAGVTSWNIDLHDGESGTLDLSNNINRMSMGFNGKDKESIFAINYDHGVGRYENPSNKNLLRLQTNGTNSSQLLQTRAPFNCLSIGNSYEDVSNNGGYRLDISGNAFIRNNTFRIKTPRTIASSGATGLKGEVCWDANYIYICVNTNSWVRLPLSTW